MHVHDVEVGVVDCSGCAVEAHLVFCVVAEPLGVDGRFGGVEERVDQRPFAGVFVAEYYERFVVEFPLGA